jgi:putative intracellular protease/amidase
MLISLLAGASALGAAGYALLPAALQAAGLHPRYHGPRHRAPGRRALIVTTSWDRLGDTGRKTGVFGSELTQPYFAFADAGMAVDVATIRGGAVPFDPMSFRRGVISAADRRARRDATFARKVADTAAIGDVEVLRYDVLFLAGGWGAAYDFAQSAALARQVTRAWRGGLVVGGVCHGPLGLLGAEDETGGPLVRGRRLTAVTDRQIRQLRITATPLHPERELRAAGALFESRTRPVEIFADHVVRDGRLVTGQNQNAGEATAQAMLEAIGGEVVGN